MAYIGSWSKINASISNIFNVNPTNSALLLVGRSMEFELDGSLVSSFALLELLDIVSDVQLILLFASSLSLCSFENGNNSKFAGFKWNTTDNPTWVCDHEKSESVGHVWRSVLNLVRTNGLDELDTLNPSRALKSTAGLSTTTSLWSNVSVMVELNGLELAKYVAHPWRSGIVGDNAAFSFGYSYTDW